MYYFKEPVVSGPEEFPQTPTGENIDTTIYS